MQYLTTFSQYETRELEAELREFFVRLRHIRRRLDHEADRLHLNRLQRSRCRENLRTLERLERDFDALSYREDIPHLYRMVHRYVKLDHQQLMERFGQETLARASLFVAL